MDLMYRGDSMNSPGNTKAYMPTVEERLISRQLALQADLKDVTEALAALQANPETLKVLNLITKVNY